MNGSLILASASPRRADLLRMIGCRLEVITSHVDEATDASLTAAQTATELAERKARNVSRNHPDRIVIGADTVVTIDDQILGKPADRDEADTMLRLLSGATHQVLTAVTLLHGSSDQGSDDRVQQILAKTDVTFRHLGDLEINRYLDSDEPYDKAGAYGIQGRASLFAERIDGCFYNVVGFPVTQFWIALEQITNCRATDYCTQRPSPDLLSLNG